MKIWIVTESAGYGDGDLVRAICTDPAAVTEYVTGGCKCSKRHDRWCSYGELQWQETVASTADFAAQNKRYLEWSSKFCTKPGRYDIEESETYDGTSD